MTRTKTKRTIRIIARTITRTRTKQTKVHPGKNNENNTDLQFKSRLQ